jgi:S-DNA-T family DNA segregation ATPase FtsK/SpoIIIE
MLHSKERYIKIITFTKLFFLISILGLAGFHSENQSFFSIEKIQSNNAITLIAKTSDFFFQFFGKLWFLIPITFLINTIFQILNIKKFHTFYPILIIIFISSFFILNNLENLAQYGIIPGIISTLIEKVFISHAAFINLLVVFILFFIFIIQEFLTRNKKLRKASRKNFQSISNIFSHYLVIFVKKCSDKFKKTFKDKDIEIDIRSLIDENLSQKTHHQDNIEIYSPYSQQIRVQREQKLSQEIPADQETKLTGPKKIFSNELNQKLYEKIYEKKCESFDNNSIIKDIFNKKLAVFGKSNQETKIQEVTSQAEIHHEYGIDDQNEITDYYGRDELLSGIKSNLLKIQDSQSNNINLNTNHIEDVMFKASSESVKTRFEDDGSLPINFSNINVIKTNDNYIAKNDQQQDANNQNLKQTSANAYLQKETTDHESNNLDLAQKHNNESQILTKSAFENIQTNPAPITETHEKKPQNSLIIKPLTPPASNTKIAIIHKKVDYGNFKLPGINFLNANLNKKVFADHHQAQVQSDKLLKILRDFSIFGRILRYHIGPVITLYEFEPIAGTKSSRVIGLCDDIARSLSAVSARISVIPGKNALGIELPNEQREIVLLRDLLSSEEYTNSDSQLPIALGKNISGEAIVVDLAKMPHLLVAGTTGSGKSVAINVMILSIVYSIKPTDCKFIMIDPKMLELSVYNGIPHLLTPVVTDPKKAVIALKWVVKEMENRYRMMSYLGVRNIAGYNEKIEEAIEEDLELKKEINIGFNKETGEVITEVIIIQKEKFPYIVVIVDEMADLMLVSGKEIEFYIQRLAQMARAAGIHIIMATQRPSVDVITGVIKANLPTRISFAVTSKIDSRTILGEQGAEQLLGMGDMLYMASGNKLIRIHGPFVSDHEIEKIVNYLKSFGPPEYLDEIVSSISKDESDENPDLDQSSESEDGSDESFYQKALDLITREKKVSISYIQRQLRIGYNKAATIVEKMEKEGIITEPNQQGKREILI